MRFTYALLISTILFFVNTSMAQNGRMLDSLELIKLYEATDGANWDNPIDRNLSMDNWEGVVLNQIGRVVEIDFRARNLNGTLIDFNLPFLEVLIISSNDDLIGNIPTFLNVPLVKELNLRDNNLDGGIPDFSNLPALTILNLEFNDLTGVIPDFTNLPNLEELRLSLNDLSGAVPNFSNIEQLEILDLGWSDLTGTIPDFSNLPNLRILDISLSDLSGEIPDFSNLPKLELLDVFSNDLVGEIPNFSNLPELKEFMVRFNELTGPIPDFTNLPNLTDLNLADNNLSGGIPDFSALPKLEFFSVNANNLTGTITDFTNLPELFIYWCEENNLTGEIPDFSNLPKLVLVWFGFNELEGAIPDFSNLPQLNDFRCEANNLTGQIPNFSNIDSLATLIVADNNLTGQLPVFSGSSLFRIECSNNQLSGKIAAYTNHPRLRILECTNNRFDQIDSSFFQNKTSTSISRVLIAENNFTYEDIIPLVNNKPEGIRLEYISQDSIFQDTTFSVSLNSSFTIDLLIDKEVTSNIYTWYKNGSSYQTIAGNNQLTFPNIEESDAGIYTVEVTNSNLPDLILYSRTMTIETEEQEMMQTVSLTVGEKEGAPNETIFLPILLNEANTFALATMEGEIKLDNSGIGNIIGIQNKGIDNVIFNADNGKFNWFDATGTGVIPTNDTLFCLQIALTGEQGDSALVNLDSVKLWTFEQENFTEVNTTTEAGKVKILANFALLGQVQTYENKGINQANIRLQSTYQNVVTTDSTFTLTDGSYRLPAIQVGSDLFIQPTKEGPIQNGLSTVALFLAQRFLLGFEVPDINSPFQLAAGDANCDGRMSVVDLFLIQRAIVGIDNKFLNCPNWKFVPEEEAINFVLDANNYYTNFPYPSEVRQNNQRMATTIDFIGMKTGDILNRADLSSFRTHLGQGRTSINQPPLNFYFPRQELLTGDTACMQLKVTAFDNIGSLQFSMNWDTTKLQLLATQSFLENTNINTNTASDGRIAISWFDIEGKGVNLPDSTSLLELCFIAIDDTDGTFVSVLDEPTPIEIAQFDGTSVNIIEATQTPTEVVIRACEPISLGPDALLCPNTILTLDAISGSQKYEWTQNGKTIFTADSIGVYDVTEAGIYSVTKTVAANCILQDTIAVNFTQRDTTIQEQFICGMVAARFDTTYLSNQFGCDSIVVVKNFPTFMDTTFQTSYTCSPLDTGQIEQLFVNESGCDSFVVQRVLLEPLATDFELTISPADCSSSTVNLAITPDNLTSGPYLYSINNGFTFTTDSIFSNVTTGDYQIIIENFAGCQQLLSTTIEGNQPTLNLSPQQDLVLGDSVLLLPELTNFDNPTVQWTPNSFLSCSDCLNPIAAPTNSMTYTLKVTNEVGCVFEKAVRIRVDERLKLFVPNIFSPNGDGVNDQLIVYTGAGIEAIDAFKIFNRSGFLIYQANGEGVWDGTVNGQLAATGTYLWMIELLKNNGKNELKTGTVNLLR